MEENNFQEEKNDEIVDDNLDATKEELKEESQMDEGSIDFKKLQEEKEELNSQYLRMTADFQNYKKRVEKEKSDIYQFANEKLILDLLPIVDNFERAVKSYKDEGKDESFTQGVEMILQQFLEVFKKNGAEEIEALGKEFDPNFHHAVMQEESDEHESNTVIDVFQKGYILNGKTIRPSMVKVVK
ncbi:nucleotide exchange factor GrpE [Crassaminicella profunda]|uniref:nucleotide exchange factor GrpE n=1 Tax=Crassaminicella profunda TaxID=1286698 RepID=UPI001CA65120|nr:nucleotide exchange factor GrpE [Crassaminicella profunda]QZY56539.1 nucleotide exchange factor GrpE [Crassaminicella profunda]